MAAIVDQLDRNVIPRWRSFATTVHLGELTEAATTREFNSPQPDLSNLESDWRENRSLSFAGDLLSAAIFAEATEVALEAARFVLEQHDPGAESNPLLRLAIATVNRSVHSTPVNEVHTYSVEQSRLFIAEHKRALRMAPGNAVLWVDLALLYAMRGQPEPARRSMTIALGLSPENRFVLRSAARFFIHLNEPDRAHQILRKSRLRKFDPWISSAEIATATAANFIPFSIDYGLKMANAETFRPSETTELSAAIATLELRDGNTKKAKKHLKNGLREPNENSLAQVKWISKDINGFLDDLTVKQFQVERSFEAKVWESRGKGDWNDAGKHAIDWLRDQPFSSRPAQVACHLASALLEDYSAAVKLANFGLVANPQDHFLYIGLAFAHASNNELVDAKRALDNIRGPMVKAIEVASIANHGLIEFRKRNLTGGRALYGEAVRAAVESKDKGLHAAALTYWAREEAIAKTELASVMIENAANAIKAMGTIDSEPSFVLDLVRKRYEQRNE
jgi:tetratricopeptide (TPR) repeat protein